MSKSQTIKMIEMEVDKLNKEIDLRIIKNLPYQKEARRHKVLLSQLTREQYGYLSWFEKSVKTIRTFIV